MVATSEKVEGRTPGGGDYSIVYFKDKDGNRTSKENAAHYEIQEYTKDGKLVQTTYS